MSDTSVHIWKSLAHGRWRREWRDKYTTMRESICKEKYFAYQRLIRDNKAGVHYTDEPIDNDGWYSKFEGPDVFERRFTRWYGKQAVMLYKRQFGWNSLTIPQEEDLAREFGWNDKKYVCVPGTLDEASDASSEPADEDDWGNKLDEPHR